MTRHLDTIANRIFISAGLINLGAVLFFSRLFTNPALTRADPVVMSPFGLVSIMLWGLAYLAAARSPGNRQWLAGVFAIEKALYGVVWLCWLQQHRLAAVFADDALAGVFYSIYGINDLAFMLLFAWLSRQSFLATQPAI